MALINLNRIPTGQSGPYCKLIFLMDTLMRGERQKILGRKTEALTWRIPGVHVGNISECLCTKMQYRPSLFTPRITFHLFFFMMSSERVYEAL